LGLQSSPALASSPPNGEFKFIHYVPFRHLTLSKGNKRSREQDTPDPKPTPNPPTEQPSLKRAKSDASHPPTRAAAPSGLNIPPSAFDPSKPMPNQPPKLPAQPQPPPQQPQQQQQQQHQGPPPSYSQAQLQEIQRVQQNTILRRMIQTGIMPPNFTDHQKMIFKQLQEKHLQEQAAAAAGGASGPGAGAKGASPLLPSANITGASPNQSGAQAQAITRPSSSSQLPVPASQSTMAAHRRTNSGMGTNNNSAAAGNQLYQQLQNSMGQLRPQSQPVPQNMDGSSPLGQQGLSPQVSNQPRSSPQTQNHTPTLANHRRIASSSNANTPGRSNPPQQQPTPAESPLVATLASRTVDPVQMQQYHQAQVRLQAQQQQQQQGAANQAILMEMMAQQQRQRAASQQGLGLSNPSEIQHPNSPQKQLLMSGPSNQQLSPVNKGAEWRGLLNLPLVRDQSGTATTADITIRVLARSNSGHSMCVIFPRWIRDERTNLSFFR
jgi:hypothetical protein